LSNATRRYGRRDREASHIAVPLQGRVTSHPIRPLLHLPNFVPLASFFSLPVPQPTTSVN
jgi:hypothetical protein